MVIVCEQAVTCVLRVYKTTADGSLDDAARCFDVDIPPEAVAAYFYVPPPPLPPPLPSVPQAPPTGASAISALLSAGGGLQQEPETVAVPPPPTSTPTRLEPAAAALSASRLAKSTRPRTFGNFTLHVQRRHYCRRSLS